ncbi:MAG: XRE family transcriptional regulator [Solirubrobacterales bacterium]
MAKNFKDIKHKVDDLPEEEADAIRQRVAYEYLAEREAYEHSLAEVRKALAMTQAQLASQLQVSQAQVSRIENQTDLFLSTLASYIEAMGGRLEISARFDGVDSPISLAVGEVSGRELVEA